MQKLKKAVEGKWGLGGLFAVAFLESSFVPFPMEVFLVPALLWQRDRAWLLAGTVLAGCITASIAFYVIGYYLFDTIGTDLSGWLGLSEALRAFERDLATDGFWLIASISFFPLPLQVATLGSGAFDYPFLPFLLAIIVTRGVRFFGLTLIVLTFGDRARRLVGNWHPAAKTIAVLTSLILVVGLYGSL